MDKRIATFQKTVGHYYRQHGRHDLPWRQPEPDGGFDPYKIWVSEVMLQQTQVGRVIPKYEQFLEQFPSLTVLAKAPLSEVIQLWSGLGYNRRAKYLWQATRQVQTEHGGRLPATAAELVKLPGIGPNTAGAIVVYAFNRPALFVETNIRTVFIHHFFKDRQGIDDHSILELVERTLPDEPREWYWALMDYGTQLKQVVGNLNVLSKTYIKQSRFEGSIRQIRGQVLRLLAHGPLSSTELATAIADDRLGTVLHTLAAEGFVAKTRSVYHLPGY
jgi:A/G-specific adenine glycosylase